MFIDPGNDKICENISNVRKFFIMDLVERLEAEIFSDLQKTCSTVDKKKKVKEAEELIKAKKFDEAKNAIEEISKADPDCDEIYFLNGFALYMSGALKEAQPLLRKVLHQNPKHHKAADIFDNTTKLIKLIDEAAAKQVEKKHADSIDLLTKALAIDKSNSKINQAVYFQRAMAQFSLGNSAEAYSDFKMFEGMQIEN